MLQAFLASALAGLATLIGALPIVVLKRISHSIQDSLLGFAAGVMIAASFALVGSGVEQGSLFQVAVGVLIGASFVAVVGKMIPEDILEKLLAPDKRVIDISDQAKSFRLAWMTFAAITLHNIPEGLAVGVGYGSGNENLGLLLAMTIGIQNAPEGLVVAAPLRERNVSVGKILFLVMLSGLVEPFAALIGLALVKQVSSILPLALGFAAGAMLYVVSKELIPESHGHGYTESSTFALIFGVLTMLFIDYSLG